MTDLHILVIAVLVIIAAIGYVALVERVR